MNPLVSDRIEAIVARLSLKPHPEGGYYSESYRSHHSLDLGRGKRDLSTAIYFLLRSGEVSHFHKIASDELWFWHEGSALDIHILGENGHEILPLGPLDTEGCAPQQLVKANSVFGSTVIEPDSYSLVSCVVSPGFDFRDFELFSKEDLLQLYPEATEIISLLT